MLTRVDSFFDLFELGEEDRRRGRQLAAETAEAAEGRTHLRDYEALAAIALHARPSLVFEIGTYLGLTSDFFLQLLPECRVLSIAYVNPRWRIVGNRSNNSSLPEEQIGSRVHPDRRDRFTQLIGSSHDLVAEDLLAEHGYCDMIFIDGDHSRDGVAEDTELARELIDARGVICWHDANPREKYLEVRRFLEQDLPLSAAATLDDYIGGIACWQEGIERRLAPAGTAGSGV